MTQMFPLPRVDYGIVNPVPFRDRTPGFEAASWDARIANDAPRVPWHVFLREILDWKQGEHVGIIGPTGQGKTTLLTSMLPLQPYVVVFATKPYDTTMDRLIASGYSRLDRWESLPADRSPRRVLWPSAADLDSEKRQREVFSRAMAMIYRERGWTVVLDEGSFFTNELGMKQNVKTYLMQGRSLGISLVFATQRPAFIPLEVYDQSTHLFLFRDNDERNLSRLGGISWRNGDLVRRVVANLERYQLLYVNTRNETMVRTRVPAPAMVRREVAS